MSGAKVFCPLVRVTPSTLNQNLSPVRVTRPRVTGYIINVKRRVPGYAIPNQTYFITTAITESTNIFLESPYAEIVLENLNFYLNKFQAQLHGYVIMPNHFHLLLTLGAIGNISQMIGQIKEYSAKQIIRLAEKNNQHELLAIFHNSAKKYRPEQKYQVWQMRFDEFTINNHKTFQTKLNYIHNNPCNKGWKLAEKPEEYRYSSARFYFLDENCEIEITPLIT